MEAFGVVGLGRIGGGLAQQALGKGFQVVGKDPYLDESSKGSFESKGLVIADSHAALVAELPRPRKVFLYIHAGKDVDTELDALVPHLEAGDIVVDGGNSYWGDSVRRAQRCAAQGIHFVDLGTSGGVIGAETGACFMAGGNPEAVQALEPILRALSVENGYVYAGESGAGHFVKLVHNGIEFGMLQAIGEGIALMERHHQQLPVADVLNCWRHGSVVRSWLIDLMEAAYREDQTPLNVPEHVEDTGEVNWLIVDALHQETPIPVISASVTELLRSRDTVGLDHRGVAMMRKGFGGHPYGPHKGIAKDRRESRVQDYIRPHEITE